MARRTSPILSSPGGGRFLLLMMMIVLFLFFAVFQARKHQASIQVMPPTHSQPSQ